MSRGGELFGRAEAYAEAAHVERISRAGTGGAPGQARGVCP